MYHLSAQTHRNVTRRLRIILLFTIHILHSDPRLFPSLSFTARLICLTFLTILRRRRSVIFSARSVARCCFVSSGDGCSMVTGSSGALMQKHSARRTSSGWGRSNCSMVKSPDGMPMDGRGVSSGSFFNIYCQQLQGQTRYGTNDAPSAQLRWSSCLQCACTAPGSRTSPPSTSARGVQRCRLLAVPSESCSGSSGSRESGCGLRWWSCPGASWACWSMAGGEYARSMLLCSAGYTGFGCSPRGTGYATRSRPCAAELTLDRSVSFS
ncbi:hypothetical protein C8Q76DRAFT_200390 [Earliella scabrosa]|nr:hypothetical protein C8Q76DRAFT_200390 [Earliella scabrosa]